MSAAGTRTAPLVWRWGQPAEPLAALLAAGGMLAIPTESSYGLAVDPRHAGAVEAVFRLKGRGRGKALPVLAADRDQLAALGVETGDPGVAAALALWPAALTVVAPLGPGARLAAAADDGSLAVRIPAHQRLRALLRALGTAVTATSANRAGEAAICDLPALADLLAAADVPAAIVDGGALPGGPPSTLARWRGGRWQVLRAGAFALEPVPAGGG